jgi:hypothetical protein
LTSILWCQGTVVESGGVGTGVTQWTDLSGNARHGTAAGAATPAYSATGGPNSTPLLTFDGVANIINFPWNPPAPGTNNIFIWAVIRALTQTSGDVILGGQSATTLALVQLATAGQCRAVNTTNGPTNANLTLGTSRRIELLFTASVADYLKVGSVPSTGTNLGNTDATTFNIGGRSGGNFSNIGVSDLAIFTGAGPPTPTELNNLDNYALALYGASALA